MGTSPPSACRRGYAEIRGQKVPLLTHAWKRNTMGAITTGVICYIALISAIPHLWFVSRQQRVDGEESAVFQGGTIDAPLCVPLDCWDCSEKNVRTFYVK